MLVTCVTGAKLATVSKLRFLMRLAFAAMVPDPNRNVYPSGAALATPDWATVPEAPARFSMMICVLSSGSSREATRRATTSVLPPAAKPTTKVTGRRGQDPAAD